MKKVLNRPNNIQHIQQQHRVEATPHILRLLKSTEITSRKIRTCETRSHALSAVLRNVDLSTQKRNNIPLSVII